MNCEKCAEQRDYGMNPYVVNVEQCTIQNRNYRRAVWTGCYLQMTVMSISACEETGPEFHKDMDQYIRVVQGNAIVKVGRCRKCMDLQESMCRGDAVFVPSGNWHNIINIGKMPLKLSVIYAPPHYRKGTVNQTKADDLHR